MPNYVDAVAAGSPQACSLMPGDRLALFNAESPAAPQASIAFNRSPGPGDSDQGVTFTISFAAAPTDSLVIQGSNVDADAQYQTLFTSTNKQLDTFTDVARFTFYRAKIVTQSAGGACTVVAQR